MVYSNTCSPIKEINLGVPQGSLLAPLLFSIYLNDIEFSVNLKSILYADDSCFYKSDFEIRKLLEDVNRELITLNEWIMANRLTINIDKSHCIIFHRNKKIPNPFPKLYIDNRI